MSDAEVVALVKQMAPDGPQKAQILALPPAQRRAIAKEMTKEETMSADTCEVESAKFLFGPQAARSALRLWRERRSLPLPAVVCREHSSSSNGSARDGRDDTIDPGNIPQHVNPLGWPATRPYTLTTAGGGGLQMPFDLLAGCYSLPCMSERHVKKRAVAAGGLFHPALQVYAAAAVALRRLVAADALAVELDIGDVNTVPRRLAAAKQGKRSRGSKAGSN